LEEIVKKSGNSQEQ